MSPLHFGHSINPSSLLTCTAAAVLKQELHQIVTVRNFNILAAKYLPPRATRGIFGKYKNVHPVGFLFKE
jgi:hypothetical protein